MTPAVCPENDLDVRLVRADCLELLHSLPDSSVDLVTTDPAYSGMNQHLKLGRGRIVGSYAGAGQPGERWFQEFKDDPDSFRTLLGELHRVLKPDRHLYVMFDSYSLLSLGHLVRERFDVKNVLVWDKVNLGMGHYFRRRHELIVFASKGKRPLSRRDLPDVWPVKRLSKARYATQKPVELFERMIEASAEPGFTVLDPFMGSGSAAVAALRQGCRFVGGDVSAEAVAFAEMRVAALRRGHADPLQPGSALALPFQDLRRKRRATARQSSTTSGVPSA
ncbi:MAG TPA: site-specific DNA-methyltransferase [Myxococcales bacterium]|nr:site-specific DNA-methyltransferase [Myxococcales bacterium]